MREPVMEDDVVSGCAHWLATGMWCPDPPSLPRPFEDDLLRADPPLGHYPGRDKYYLFQENLMANLEGSGSNAVVISYAGTWGGAGQLTSWQFFRISLDIWCDPIRGSDAQLVTAPGFRMSPISGPPAATAPNAAHFRIPIETRRRVMKIYHRFDKYLHRPQGGVQWWGSVRTVGCERIGGLNLYSVPDGEKMIRGQVLYGVSVG